MAPSALRLSASAQSPMAATAAAATNAAARARRSTRREPPASPTLVLVSVFEGGRGTGMGGTNEMRGELGRDASSASRAGELAVGELAVGELAAGELVADKPTAGDNSDSDVASSS